MTLEWESFFKQVTKAPTTWGEMINIPSVKNFYFSKDMPQKYIYNSCIHNISIIDMNQ